MSYHRVKRPMGAVDLTRAPLPVKVALAVPAVIAMAAVDLTSHIGFAIGNVLGLGKR